METAYEIQPPASRDRLLHWSMRVVGLVLLGVSLFLASQDITQTAAALWFFRISAGLGGLTFLSSWLSEPKRRRPS